MLCWANVADRMRIKGISKEYAELLAGRRCRYCERTQIPQSANLAKAMADANKRRKIVRLLPSEKVVKRWIENAKILPLKITY